MASEHFHVLVTGANSGLGLNICLRLIDDFCNRKSQFGQLTLIFTTRSSKKGADTLKVLQAHLSRHKTSTSLSEKINFLPENVDLTDLLSVRALAQRLIASTIPKLDAIILNAGIIGLVGLNWPQAIWTVTIDPVHTLTWPRFKISAVGLVTKPQISGAGRTEPVLGEVFCANIFGHYLLAHWLMPLLRACDASSPGKVVWISSIEASARHFNGNDLQGLRSSTAYEHSKRLTDLMALTATGHTATARSIETFVTPTLPSSGPSSRSVRSKPTIHAVHPGVCVTAIVPLPWILLQLFTLSAYLSRFLGSPWATVSPYPGAASATWLTLASREEIAAKEASDGGRAVKWGSAVERTGTLRVEKTDVEGWGIDGSGASFADTWWATDVFGSWGRVRGSTDATKDHVEAFVEDGARVWRGMEQLRVDWEARLEEHELAQKES